MEDLTKIEKELKRVINKDIEASLESKKQRKDPLGDSIYLFFLLKNNIESSAVDDLIDRMNLWVESVLSREQYTRFVDRDLTSALLGYHSLRSVNRLAIKIDIEKVNEILSKFLVNDLVFGDITYSAIILYSLANQKDEVPIFSQVLNRIKKEIDAPLFNDAKNFVFVSMLLDKLGIRDHLKKLVNLCFERFQKNDVPFDDRVYYAWTLWNYRKIREKNIARIADFVQETLKNATQIISKEIIEEPVTELYGQDIILSPSRILLATTLDLLMTFKHDYFALILPNLQYIEPELRKLGWNEVLEQIDKALTEFENGQTSTCCYSLRMGLFMMLDRVHKTLTGESIPSRPGKSPSIEPVIKLLKQHGFDEQMIGLIKSVWAYATERGHIEKKGGQKPPEDETMWILRMVLATIEFLLRRFTN